MKREDIQSRPQKSSGVLGTDLNWTILDSPPERERSGKTLVEFLTRSTVASSLYQPPIHPRTSFGRRIETSPGLKCLGL